MQSFLIIHKDSSEIEDIRQDTKEITNFSEKTEILNKLDINYSKIELDNYRFFDEGELCKKNKIYDEYIDTVLDVYFPSKWDPKSQKWLYYPEEKIVKEDPFTVFVYRWNTFKFTNKVKNIHYVCEDEKSARRAMIVISDN